MEALLSAVGRQVLYAAAVFVLVAPVCAVLVRRWPYRAAPLRSALWALVLLRLCLPLDLTLPWSAGALLGDDAVSLFEAASLWDVETASPASTAVVESTEVRAPSDPGPSLPWRLLLVLGVWGGGALVSIGVFARRRRRFRRLASAAEPVTGSLALEIAERWRGRLGIRRPVRLVSGAVSVSPFTLGSARPVLYLPAVLLDEARRSSRRSCLEAVVAHEMVHIARWDDLRLLVQRLVQGLWFFHPVVWLAGARLHEERERLCDARVLACGELSPRDYGRSVLTVVRLNLEGAAPLPAFGLTKGRTAMRIREVIHHGHRRPRTLPALAALTVLGLFLLPLAPTSGAGAAAEPSGDLRAEHSARHSARHQEGHSERHAVQATRHAQNAWGQPVPQGRLTSPFGERVHPFSGERVHHRGVDLAAAPGTPILSPAPGRVTVATERYEGGDPHGTVVVLDHGEELQSFYSHLDSLAVSVGQEVARGQQVGTVGSTGEVTGAHLHFEVWRDGQPVDPGELVPALR